MNGTISVAAVYGVVTILSLMLAIGYLRMVKQREFWLLVVNVAVFVVNAGYFMLSVSKTLEGALAANRISYFGSVFLPLGMLMTIIRICKVKYGRVFVGIMVGISIAVFLLAASGGYLDIYYKSVTLETINGASKLVKEYGPLHCLYLFYLLGYFGAMVGVIWFSARRKDDTPHKFTTFLAAIVLGNVGIWFVEQLIRVDFEFLSVSYVITECLLLLVYGMVQDGMIKETPKVEDSVQNAPSKSKIPLSFGMEVPELTSREEEVLYLLLENIKRKEIAERLGVSENTVKKHTSHIFTKMQVTNRKELFEKFQVECQVQEPDETEEILREQSDGLIAEQVQSSERVQEQYPESLQKDKSAVPEQGTTLDDDQKQMFLSGIGKLTQAENRIYSCYLERKNTKEILGLLNITENTLKYHNKNIYGKLGVKTRKELLLIAESLIDSENGTEMPLEQKQG